MAKSKRKTSKSAAGVSAKKKRDDTSCAQHSHGPSFDDLCDNTLLRILSYTDDLRSLISLTRCTSKSLRKRFDLKGDKNTPEYSEQYKKFWQGVFADLQMAPLEESDSKSHDYIAAINYRLTLFNNLIGHEKRKKAGANRSYSLPLRQHNFKSVDAPWNYGDDDDSDEEEPPQDTMANPFALMSRGTGQEYVIVDPKLTSVDIHYSILERVQCLDKSTQKKRETAQRSEQQSDNATRSETEAAQMNLSGLTVEDSEGRIVPSQVLLNSYRHFIDQEGVKSRAETLSSYGHRRILATMGATHSNDLVMKWYEYFGDDTPFGPNVVPPPRRDDRRIYIQDVSIKVFDSMDDDRMTLQEKRIVLCRLIRNQDGRKCTEFIVWGDSGCEGRNPWERFEMKTILRIPAQLLYEVVSTDGDKLYAALEGNPYNQSDPDKTVYQFSLSPNIEDRQQYYARPEFYFSTISVVTQIHPIGRNHVLVGTHTGTIEIWDCSDKSAPNRVKYLHAFNAFNVVDVEDEHLNGITGFLLGRGKLQNFFFTSQENGSKGVITLWQTPHQRGVLERADFKVMVRIKYEGYINFASNGHSLMVLAHDRFGSLYLDVYHLPGSRYVLNEFDDVSLPKGVEFDLGFHNTSDFYTLPDSGASQHLKFANRINIRHRVDIDEYGPFDFLLDVNDRLVVIEAYDGLVGNNGESKSDSPGLIIIDLDEHASGLPSYPLEPRCHILPWQDQGSLVIDSGLP